MADRDEFFRGVGVEDEVGDFGTLMRGLENMVAVRGLCGHPKYNDLFEQILDSPFEALFGI